MRDDALLDELDSTDIYKSHGTNPDHIIRRYGFRSLTIGNASSSTKPVSKKAWKCKYNRLENEWWNAYCQIEDKWEAEVDERMAILEKQLLKERIPEVKSFYQRRFHPYHVEQLRLDQRYLERLSDERGEGRTGTGILPSLSPKDRIEINKHNSGVEKILEVYNSGRSMYVRNESVRTYEVPSEWRYHYRYLEFNKYYESLEAVLEAFESGANFLLPHASQLPVCDEEEISWKSLGWEW
jgi:hypothetical protein